MRISYWSSDVCSFDLIGIDGNITVRQIAGPNGRASFLQAQVDFDVNFPAFEMRCPRSFVIVFNGKATPRHLHTAEADGTPIAARWFACLAAGHYDPAPIRTAEHTSELQSLMRTSYAV